MVKELHKWIISLIIATGFIYGIYLFVLKSLFISLGIQSMSILPTIQLVVYYLVFIISILILSFICKFLITKIIHFDNKYFVFLVFIITLLFTILLFKSGYSFINFYKEYSNTNVEGLGTMMIKSMMQTLPSIKYIYTNIILVSVVYLICFVTPFFLSFKKN